jgi:hypothetical protein
MWISGAGHPDPQPPIRAAATAGYAEPLADSAPVAGWRGVLNLIKLSVGPKDVAQLAAIQKERLRTDPPLRAWTRMFPKRVEEVCAGGSIYWVVAGFVRVRQRILEIREEEWDDGTPCAALVLDPTLVPVEARPMKPFQGWRYLKPEEAPPDVARERPVPVGLDRLPPKLRRDLAELCLI